MMEGRTFAINELFTQALTLPIDLRVIKGHRECNPWQCLDTDTTIRLHFFRDEPVVTGSLEGGNQQLTIPLHSDELFEPLPATPELDDMQYETAGQLLAAQPMPSAVRVTQSWDGGDEESTIQVNDEIEDMQLIDDDVLGRCMVAKRVMEVDEGNNVRERVCVGLNTAGVFTTKANPLRRYTPVDLVRLKSLPRRMRVHVNRRGRSGVPALPVKIDCMGIGTRRTAVCNDLHSGRLFVLSESLQDVQLQRIPLVSTSKDWAQPLYLSMDCRCVPLVGPEAFDHVFKSQAPSPRKRTKQKPGILTVLLSSPTSCMVSNATDLPDYRTFTRAGTETDADSVVTNMVRINSAPGENVITRNQMLYQEANVIEHLKNVLKVKYETFGDDFDDDYSSDLEVSDDYEVPSKMMDHYECIEKPKVPTAKKSHYTRLNPINRETDVLYAEADALYEKPDKPEKPVPPSKPSKVETTAHVQLLEEEISEWKRKVTSMKEENEKLVNQISETGGRIDLIRVQIQTLDSRHQQKVNETNPEVFSQLLQSLSNIQVIQLLEKLRLGQYVDKFLEAAVEGYELEACDRTYLEDVGMKPSHAVKLLTILKGRLPPGWQWETLLQ